MLSIVADILVDSRRVRDDRRMTRRRRASPRRRLDAAAARELILDATEKRLALAGPSGIRLKDVAAAAGVSHPTVLHHFGSRGELVKAVITRSMRAVNASLVAALEATGEGDPPLEALLENVAAAFEGSGHARVVLWLALEGHRIDGAEARLVDVVSAAHAVRAARDGCEGGTREDTARTVVLAALALVSGAVIGEAMLGNAGLAEDAREPSRFRAWLAGVLREHLEK